MTTSGCMTYRRVCALRVFLRPAAPNLDPLPHGFFVHIEVLGKVRDGDETWSIDAAAPFDRRLVPPE
jgi:hypothetical protein